MYRYLLSLLWIALVSCSVVNEPLMPTPIFFQLRGISPIEHLTPEERWNFRRVYYVTTRARNDSMQRIDYGNNIDYKVNVGMTAVGFGGDDISWASLNQVSKQYPRDQEIPLSLAGIFEAGNFTIDKQGEVTETQGATNWLLADINSSIAQARKKDILIYVHGAKVNFYNANVFAAQLDHFMGRNMTSMAFSWPTRQNILAYSFGDDVNRAYNSAPVLTAIIKKLAEKSNAQRIHILTWSAGGRLVSTALKQLRDQYPQLDADQLRDKFRLGTVYFAAADVPADEFVERLAAINELSHRVVVTASSDDGALKSSEMFMRGASRIGLLNPELSEAQKGIILKADRLEYVDMSEGSDQRGFDIIGHRYWFNHPWASTDALLSIATDLPPEERGLERTGSSMVWWMSDDYPDRVRNIRIGPDQWFGHATTR